MKLLRWKKLSKKDYKYAEKFLHAREKNYVNACARFLQLKAKDEIWGLPGDDPSHSPYKALLIHCRQTLYPVFDGRNDIPLPSFLERILMKVYVHALQGPMDDVVLLESLMKTRSYLPSETINYDLMSLEEKPDRVCFNYGPKDLILRKPEKKDFEQIFDLQAAYEKEEVLPGGAVFNPAVCRLNLERILKTEEMLLAVTGNEIAAKINTNAASFGMTQIGGVYTKPSFRRQGIAVRMTAAFLEEIISNGNGASLFVKKNNAAAKAVYQRIGFTTHGSYRISYF